MSAESIYSPIIFIGREQELALFKQMLEQSGETQTEWILNVHGDGGIGKTQLLQHYAELALQRQKDDNSLLVTRKAIDLYLTTHQTELGILKSIADQLGPEQFESFYTAFQQLYQSPDALASLRDKFLESYQHLTNIRQIILIFDTTEVASEAIKRFFNEMLPHLKEVHPGTFVIAAGRLPLLTVPHHSIKMLHLTGLSSQEIGQYFTNQQIEVSPTILNRLAELSGGRPILIALMVDWMNLGETPEELLDSSPQVFEKAMVERVSQLWFPEDQVILAMAHCYRRFNDSMLAYLFDKPIAEATALIESLARFSFVKYRPAVASEMASCLLHDEMRELVRKHVLSSFSFDPLYTMRRDWSAKIVDYYAKFIETAQNNSIEKSNLERERLYYWLDANLEEGWNYWRTLFRQGRNPEEREAINAEVPRFELQLSAEKKCEFQLRQADIFYARGEYSQAASLFEKVFNTNHCSLAYQSESRAKLILCYTNSGEVLKAIEFGEASKTWFDDMLKKLPAQDSQRSTIQLQFGYLHNNLGYAYRKQNQIDRSLTHYQTALELYKNIEGIEMDKDKATTKNNLGYVLHLLGRDDEAISHCRGALKIKQRLGGDPYELGLTYNVFGMIEADSLRDQQAITYFEKALKDFKAANSERGQALVYIAWGRMLRQLGWAKVKVYGEDKEVAKQNYLEAGKMFEQAVAMLRNTDKSSLMEALSEQGILLRNQGNLSKSITCFNDSNELANRVKNEYVVADNLQNMGYTVYLDGNLELALTLSQQAIDIAKQHEYLHILGRALLTIARVRFAQKDYPQAFESVIDSIKNILETHTHGIVDTPVRRDNRYFYWADQILNMIEKLPSALLKRECGEYLIQHWPQEGLTEKYPGFIIAVGEVAGI